MTEKADIWRLLKTIPYPGYTRDIVAFGMVRAIDESAHGYLINLGIGHLTDETQQLITGAVTSVLRDSGAEFQIKLTRPEQGRSRYARSAGGELHAIPRGAIRNIVAVASGKGGVGKSTVAVNLAVALGAAGFRTGLMDADAYGPNVPRMMGATERLISANGLIQPAAAHGIRFVSVGLIVADDQPLVWRGPITHKLIRQLVVDVAWGELDVLVVDLPPGTGDIPISIAQDLRPDGAVIVATPQAVAVDDARRAVMMLQRLNVPIWGVIENMSRFICTECGTEHQLFGSGGMEQFARSHEFPFLGSVPFLPAIRDGGDSGAPVAARGRHAETAVFAAIAEAVSSRLHRDTKVAL